MGSLAEKNRFLLTEEQRIEAVIRSVVSSSAAESITVRPSELREAISEHLRSKPKTTRPRQ